LYRLAKLTESQIREIRKLEERWENIVVLAYEKPREPARLSSKQLEKIRTLEKELKVALVAYK
jgi:hypothetical protein